MTFNTTFVPPLDITPLSRVRKALVLMRPHLGMANTLAGVQCALLIAELGDGCTPRQVAMGVDTLPAYVNLTIRNMARASDSGMPGAQPPAPLVRHHLPDGGRANADTPITITEHGKIVFAEIEALFAE